MKPKVYLAARYSRQLELRKYAEELEALGCEIVSRWLWEDPKFAYLANVKEFHGKDPNMTQLALEDEEQVLSCNLFIIFTDSMYPGVPRNSKNVELGMALATNKLVVTIGPLESLFNHLPRIETFERWEDFVEYLLERKDLPWESA